MKLIFSALVCITLSVASLSGMTSIENLKKLDPSSLTADQKIQIGAVDMAKNIFAEFERITKLSSEKTLANAYAILGFDLTKQSAQNAPLGLYTSRSMSTQPKIVWLSADQKTVDFMKSVQDALSAAYSEAATTLKDTTLIQSTFDSVIKSKKYTPEVQTRLLEIYYTYEFFPDADSVPDEVFMATLLLFKPEFTQAAEDMLRKRTSKKIVEMIAEKLKQKPIQSAQDWTDTWTPFFTNQANYKTGLLLNTVSYPTTLKDITLVGLAAQQLIKSLQAITVTEKNFAILENLKKSISTPWWASGGNAYFSRMIDGMPIMLLILTAKKGYNLALNWPKFFPGKTIEYVAELVKKGLSAATQSGDTEAIEWATFQNTVIKKMGKSLVGSEIVALKKESPNERAKKLLEILNQPGHIGDLIYYRQRTTYPAITIAEIESVITHALSAQNEIDPSALIALASRICTIDRLTQSQALSAPIADQAREILLSIFAHSLETVNKKMDIA